MRPVKFNPWLALALMGGIAYPLLVYLGMGTIPHAAFILIALALIALRLIGMRKTLGPARVLAAFAFIACFMAAIIALDSALAVKAYPIIVSLGICSIFAWSLIYPPSAVERMARLTEPNLPPKGIIYTRKVTMVWVVFLLLNAAISAATAVWGTLAQWTLWNGLIAYLMMGTLFAGEYFVRKRVRR